MCASQAAKQAGALAQDAAATAVEAAEARCVALSAAAAEEKGAMEDTLAAVQAALTLATSKVAEGSREADDLRHQLARASEEAQKCTAQAEAATEALDGALEAKAALQLELKASISTTEVCAPLPPHPSPQIWRKPRDLTIVVASTHVELGECSKRGADAAEPSAAAARARSRLRARGAGC